MKRLFPLSSVIRLPFLQLCSLLVFALTIAAASRADAAGLLIADGGLGGVLEIQAHEVRVTINNGIAVTEVTQVFLNTENRQVEALYTFPVPRSASVANFSMWIDGKEMVGEVVEKQRAREIYNSYKAVRRDPGLLEQTDYKTFEMRIFPIAPRAQQKVQVTYYQELDVDHDWATYTYPLATLTRRGIDAQTRGKFSMSVEVKSEVPIVAMESPSHRDAFAIAQHTENYQQASLETAGGDLSRDIVVAYHLARPRTGVDFVTSRQDGEDGYFCLILTPGQELEGKQPAADYVFLLDISGSMAQDGKLATSRDAANAFIQALAPEDRFEVMAFNVQPIGLFRQLQPATPENRAQAAQFLDRQDARGGTVLRPAMAAAYQLAAPDRPLNVIVLSDGITDQGERAALLQAIAQRPNGARVFCIGVGNEVNKALLEEMAQDSGGLAGVISPGDDFARQAQAFRRKLTRPAASNLQITFDGGKVYDLEPLKLPDLYHGSPVRLYGRYRGSGPVNVTLAATVQGKPIAQSLQTTLPDSDPANPEIQRMWAWHRVQRLLKEADRAGSRSPVIDEIVRLGEGYSITTEYTSFLVLENDAEYKRWKIDRRNVLRLEKDRAQQQVLRQQLDSLRLRAATQLEPAPAATGGSQPVVLQPADTAGPLAAQPAVPSNPGSARRGWDLDIPTGRGGGAIDPIAMIVIAGLAGLGWMSARSARRTPHQD